MGIVTMMNVEIKNGLSIIYMGLTNTFGSLHCMADIHNTCILLYYWSNVLHCINIIHASHSFKHYKHDSPGTIAG